MRDEFFGLNEIVVSDSEPSIATETIFGQPADGEPFTITIHIGRPFKWGDDSTSSEWACHVEVMPLRHKRAIHGEGSLQALCLALRMVHTELTIFIENGGRLINEDGGEFPLAAYLPPGW